MSEFGDTLKKWEQLREKGKQQKTNPMSEALDLYPPSGRVAGEKAKGSAYGGKSVPAGRRLPISETVDLHGLTSDQALELCEAAIRRNTVPTERRRILLIHGKGIHSSRGGKLSKVVRTYLKNHPLVGETGIPPAKEGGDGAIWAVCRQRSR
jgi:DNA-nicking Smr family endonuclease